MTPRVQSLALHKPGLVVHTCNPNIGNGESGIQDHPWLHSSYQLDLHETHFNNSTQKAETEFNNNLRTPSTHIGNFSVGI